eukprot:4099400-Alexandrium_andersonii.AAC.1
MRRCARGAAFICTTSTAYGLAAPPRAAPPMRRALNSRATPHVQSLIHKTLLGNASLPKTA